MAGDGLRTVGDAVSSYVTNAVSIGSLDVRYKTMSFASDTIHIEEIAIRDLFIYGDVTFGTAANGHDIPVYIDDWRTLDAAHPNQRAVSVQAADGATPPTVTGTLHSADALRNWALTRSGNTWSVARTGLMLIFR